MNWLFDNFREFGDRKAIICNDKEFTYGFLYAQTIDYIAELSNNKVEPGAIVAILSNYSFESISVFLALALNKNIIVPITNIVDDEIASRINLSNPNYLIRFTDGRIKIEKYNNNQCINNEYLSQLNKIGNPGLILFSSGTTGIPKAMVHDLGVLIESYAEKKSKSLVFLLFLLFDHIGGLNTLLNSLSMGITIVIPDERNADKICELIQKYRIDVLPASPTFLNLLLMNNSYKKYDLSSLRLITYGTEPMSESLLSRIRNSLPKVKLIQTFGTSETGIAQVSSQSSSSIGMKINDPNLEYKIVDNVLWLKSKTQILGYLNHSMSNFSSDGWFNTGDIVEMIDDEYFKIIGRKSDIINVGGQKVFPSEVESILMQIDAVDDCLVFGEKNAMVGEIVVADIVLKENINAMDGKKIIRTFCLAKLDPYKIPVKINIVQQTQFNNRFKKNRIK